MPSRHVLALAVDALIAFGGVVAAVELPYNPTRILLSQDDNNSTAWIFSPQSSSSQSQLSKLDLSSTLDSSSTSPTVIYSTLPFLNSTTSTGYTPVIDGSGAITVFAGDCTQGSEGSTVWQFIPDSNKHNGTWSQSSVDVDTELSGTDTTYGSNFLSAGIIYPGSVDASEASIYLFGGMCPTNSSETLSTWASSASYSKEMLSLSPSTSSTSASAEVSQYSLGESDARGGPIAEAGLTMTPLSPTYSNSSTTSSSEAQIFVLLGGHTTDAFINMSQVALFSLPEQSWSFIAVDQPGDDGQTELARRDSATVEPRSGHTALLSPEGDRIFVLGGWVGDVNTPASPQLAILELGEGYGGSGDWSWTIPSTTSSPFGDSSGVYGHGAAMLPGGVMLVMGGYSMSSSSSSRIKHRSTSSTPTANSNMYMFNVTSNTWITSYTDPSATSSSGTSSGSSSSGGLTTTSQKAALSAGLVLGCSALAGLFVVYLWYSRRLRRKREARVKELHDLALSTARYQTDANGGSPEIHDTYPEMQTVGTIKRKPVPISNNPYPWAPVSTIGVVHDDGGSGEREAERTGLLLDIPSPTRGLRRGLHSRQPPSSTYSNAGHGAIHTIDENAEYEDNPAARRLEPVADSSNVNTNRYSDPFKDPPPQLVPGPTTLQRTPSETKRQRMAEIQGWVDDWSAAAAAMSLSRSASAMSGNPPKSNSNSNSHSQSTSSGRGSPDKSDRTGSNLSEASVYSSASLQRSNLGTIKRNGSTRSVSAGYAQTLFAGAAAAMGKVYNTPSGQEEQGVVPPPLNGPWRRSASLNMARAPSEVTIRPSTSGQAAPNHLPEAEGLLNTYNANMSRNARPEDAFATPPESPIKERPTNLTSSSNSQYAYSSLLPTTTSTDFDSIPPRRAGALGFLGSVKRALTGTSVPTSSSSSGHDSGVKRRILEIESRSSSTSPTKRYHNHSPTKDMTEVSRTGGNGGGGGLFYHQNRNGPNQTSTSPRRTASASASFFLGGRKGRRDWNETDHSSPIDPVSTQHLNTHHVGDGDDEWDVEKAVENRLVQVMFTVPREKLRVVNADERDRLSISDVDFEGGENVGGMDVRDREGLLEGGEIRDVEGAVILQHPQQEDKGKGKARDEEEDRGGGDSRRLQTL